MGPNARRLDELYTGFWRRGDWRAGAEIMHPEIEWRGIETDAMLGADSRGLRAVNRYFADWLEAWEAADVSWDIEEITPDVIVVHSHLKVRGRGSGIDFGSEIGQVWEFEDGLAVRETMFRTFDEARAAARALVSGPR